MLDLLGHLKEQGNGSASAHNPTRTCGIPYRLENPILLREDKVAIAAFGLPWFYGDDYQITTSKRFSNLILCDDAETTLTVVYLEHLLCNCHVVVCSFLIDIVQNQGTVSHGVVRKILHELDGPEATTASNNTDTSLFHSIPPLSTPILPIIVADKQPMYLDIGYLFLTFLPKWCTTLEHVYLGNRRR